jgi:hypothetical protein
MHVIVGSGSIVVTVGPPGGELGTVSAAPDGVTFDRMASEAPELAGKARERFGATGLALVGTLRRDGWPRISPVEPLLFDGRLYLGMMPSSTKSLDLGRDPRCLVHSTVSDKDGTDGEVKLYGHAVRVTDAAEIERYCVALEEAIGWRPGGPDDFDLWELRITSGAYVHFAEGAQSIATWRPGEPLDSYVKATPA